MSSANLSGKVLFCGKEKLSVKKLHKQHKQCFLPTDEGNNIVEHLSCAIVL